MTKTVEEMSYRELVEYVKTLPLIRNDDDEDSVKDFNYIVAVCCYVSNLRDEEENDVIMTSHFLPFFAKYYPNLNVKVGDEFGDLVERHDLRLLKAIVEHFVTYQDGIPGAKKTDAHWTLQPLENPNYTIGYEFHNEPDNLMDHVWQYVAEHANDNVYTIEEDHEPRVVEVELKNDGKLKWQSVEASVDKQLYRSDSNGFLTLEMHGEGYGETATEAMENLKQMLPPDMNFVLKVAADSKTVEEIDNQVAEAKKHRSYY